MNKKLLCLLLIAFASVKLTGAVAVAAEAESLLMGNNVMELTDANFDATTR